MSSVVRSLAVLSLPSSNARMGNVDFSAINYRCIWGIRLTSLAEGMPVAS
jgi:hypothetical protein